MTANDAFHEPHQPEPEPQPGAHQPQQDCEELQPELQPEPEPEPEPQPEPQPQPEPEAQPEAHEPEPDEQPEQALEREQQPELQPEPEPRAPSLLTSPLPHYPPSPLGSGGLVSPSPQAGQSFASLLLGVDATTGTVAVTSQLVQELVALQQRSHEQVRLFCLLRLRVPIPYAVPHICR